MVHYLLHIKLLMDTVSNELVNREEHLAAKETDVYLRSW